MRTTLLPMRLLFLLPLLGLLSGCTRPPNAAPEVPVRRPRYPVSGRVLDAETRQPVAGVAVLHGSNMLFAITDAQGRFADSVMVLPYELNRPHWLQVSTLRDSGRTSYAVPMREPVDIMLERRAQPLRFGPDSCRPRTDAVPFDPLASPGFHIGLQPAFFIAPTPGTVGRRLRTFSLRTHRLNGRERLRLRLYVVDAATGGPGDDLLTEEVYLCPPPADSTFSCDLRQLELRVPPAGFYVALEMPVSFSHEPICYPLKNYQPTGPVLRPPCASADMRSWLYTMRQSWQPMPPVLNCWPLFESLITLEVD